MQTRIKRSGRAAAICFALSAMLLGTSSAQANASTSATFEEGEEKAAPRTEKTPRWMSNARRHGPKSSLLLGVSACVKAKDGTCLQSDISTEEGSDGRTRPSFGFLKEFGYRIPWLFVGASYSLGFMRPSWDAPEDSPFDYKLAYQHSLLGVIRPMLPLWRFDIGLTVAPGWSRQVFRRSVDRDRDFTQGFALGTGGIIAFYITRRWLVGVRHDVIMNFHKERCEKVSGDKFCDSIESDSILPVHQSLTGLYLSHMWR